MSKFVGKKGFIGPIGDDLPSLIPIVSALLLFFMIFTLTLNTYNQKNSALRKQIELISVSKQLRGESIIIDFDEFNGKCDDIKLKKYYYNFMIAIYDIDSDLKTVVDDFRGSVISDEDYSDNFLKDTSGNVYFCGYKKTGSSEFGNKKPNYLLRYYPVAIQVKKHVKDGEVYVILPALMAMVVWE